MRSMPPGWDRCELHQAIADGRPPALSEWHWTVARQLLGDPLRSAVDLVTLPIPSIGHVRFRRMTIRYANGRVHSEWILA